MNYTSSTVISGKLRLISSLTINSSVNSGKYQSAGRLTVQLAFVQYDSLFARLFGMQSWQDGDSLYIVKSGLPGITPAASNTAESLLVSLLIKAFLAESSDLGTFLFISTEEVNFLQRAGRKWRRQAISVRFRKRTEAINYSFLDASKLIEPNDYELLQ
ncbi:hypothetical protein [Coleofasciculus chthonoplastes]|uniref:hypothetical protein n=1 Tax=Coleofasciculus chthonoplastes TaxID=64178 RepID=UPI0032F83DBE